MGDDPGGSGGFFGERVAAAYDERSASMFDPAVVGPAVDVLAELAGDGAALEFAVGTGRIALPLAERGVRVAGIDNSEAMVARLRGKPGAQRIDAVVGDMAATRVDGEFSLVHLVRLREDWLPHVDWVELEGVGHCPQLDVPLEAAQLIVGFTAR